MSRVDSDLEFLRSKVNLKDAVVLRGLNAKWHCAIPASVKHQRVLSRYEVFALASALKLVVYGCKIPDEYANHSLAIDAGAIHFAFDHKMPVLSNISVSLVTNFYR